MKRFFATVFAAGALLYGADNWRDQGVLCLDHSPHAVMHPVPVHAVTLAGGFWSERRKTNATRSIPVMLELLEEHGIVDNFRRLSGRKDVARRGPLYTDSDLYKWMEAVAFLLQSGDDPKLRATFDRLIDDVLAAQEPSGYLNTYWSGERAKQRFTEMTRGHELYCLGHLLQAGIAYYRATGNRKLLDGGIRFVDYLAANFGADKRPLLTGHPELEMALVELYRTTGNSKHLELAGYLLSGVESERLHLKESGLRYMFSGKPFTSRTVFEGHAVRAMYASSGAADYYMETGDAAYAKTLDTLWRDLTARKMYITGGVGSRSQGEAFGEPYELPNAQAYTESCAAIGNMMWNFRMLAARGESKYADVMERALYNGISSGVSLNGTLYCYRNPLSSSGEKIRDEWYDTTCCPPNLQRVLASLPGYFYATSKRGVYVNFYDNSDLNWHLEDGTALQIRQSTEYPWSGRVSLTVSPTGEKDFTLYARIPRWSSATAVSVNGASAGAPQPGEYLAITRRWKRGDRVELQFDMDPKLLAANPQVVEDNGKVAVQRGPLVYCLEQIDQQTKLADLLFANPAMSFEASFRGDLLGGIEVLKHDGAAYETPVASEPLYLPLNQAASRKIKPAALTLIPYYAWANREQTAMEVWIPYVAQTQKR
ncbi:MAG: glycoside hydrolase family 127 protein [Bryobacteraceae bacterium]